MPSPKTWFDKSVDTVRLHRLRTWRTYDEILDAMHEQAEIRCCGWERFAEKRLAGCRRIVFGVTLPPTLYDAFFNAPRGYRARYARSADDGTVANRLTIARFTPDLLGVARDLHVGQVPTSWPRWRPPKRRSGSTSVRSWISCRASQASRGGPGRRPRASAFAHLRASALRSRAAGSTVRVSPRSTTRRCAAALKFTTRASPERLADRRPIDVVRTTPIHHAQIDRNEVLARSRTHLAGASYWRAP